MQQEKSDLLLERVLMRNDEATALLAGLSFEEQKYVKTLEVWY